MKKTLLLITTLASSVNILTLNTINSKINTNNLTENRLETTDLNKIILNTNLFRIKTDGTILPWPGLIFNQAKKLNTDPKINWTAISVDEESITKTSAVLISTDNTIYTGTVKVSFTLDISVPLNSVITNNNLGLISLTSWSQGMLKDQIFNKVKSLNANQIINWTKISIDENSITKTGAELISTDTSIYSGVVDITFNINIVYSLNYSWDHTYSFSNTDSSDKHVLFNWTGYNWDSFSKAFSTFSFDSGSSLKIGIKAPEDFDFVSKTMDLSNFNLSNLGDNYLKVEDSYVVYTNVITLHASINLKFSHDDNNIYYQWFLDKDSADATVDLNIKLNNVTFQ